MSTLRIAWRNLWRHRRRSLLTMSAVAVALSALVVFFAIGEGFHVVMIDSATRTFLGHAQIHKDGYRDDPDPYASIDDVAAVAAAIRETAGVDGHTFRLFAPGLLSPDSGVSGDVPTQGVLITGVDPEDERRVTTLAEKVSSGRWITAGATEVALGDGLAADLGVVVGDKVAFAAFPQGAPDGRILTVVGLLHTAIDDVNRSAAFADLGEMQQLMRLEGRAHEVALRVDDPEELPAVVSALAGRLGPSGLEVVGWETVAPEVKGYVDMDEAGNRIFAAIMLLVVAVILANTMLMAVLERTRELGVLLALGTRPARLVGLVLTESALLALAGIALGGALGGSLAAWLAETGLQLGGEVDIAGVGIDSVVYLRPTLFHALLSAGLVLAFAVLAAVYPAVRAARLDPVKAMVAT